MRPAVAYACPATAVRLMVDDRVIQRRQLPATRTTRGRSMQINYLMRLLQSQHSDATRWTVEPAEWVEPTESIPPTVQPEKDHAP
jgi:hypothetical protein